MRSTDPTGSGSSASGIPLARLLALAFNDLIDALHERLRAAGWADVRRSYGVVLLAVRDREMSTTELSDVLRVTKQAASQQLQAMEASGYVERRPSEEDGRIRLVRLAPRGHDLLEAVEAIYADLEAEWDAVLGDGAVDRLRGALTEVLLVRHDGRIPLLTAP